MCDLALCLADLSEDEFFILSSKSPNYFVQSAAQGQFGMRAEATSNAYIESPEAILSADDYVAIEQLGWNLPTLGPHSEHTSDGSPNFFAELCSPVKFGYFADIAIHTQRRVYHIGHPGELRYNSFGRDVQIRFPTLRLQREK
jgi:hypothetical protein